MADQMGVTNLWALEQNHFDEDDYKWCRGLGVAVKVEPLFGDVYSYGRLVNQVVRGLRIRLTTTCEKQESMLKLKYGPRLIHIQSMMSLSPDEIQQFNF